MINPSSNPQVVLSLHLLWEALFRLLKERPFGEITISQICAEAQVARQTFYRNCGTKDDLVDYGLERAIQGLLDTAEWSNEEGTNMYRHFFSYWYGQREFLSAIWSQGLFPRFSHCFTQHCAQTLDYAFLHDFLQDKEDDGRLRLFHNAFIIGALCNMLEQWTAEGFRMPIADLVSVLQAFRPGA